MSDKIVLIDGHSIMNRAFYGIPLLSSSSGVHTNAVYGFLNILFKVLDEEKAQYLAVAFDLSAPTFRHKKYEAYKGTRHAMPDELREQIPVMKEMLQAMGVPLMMLEGYEADDLIGTASRKAEENGLEVRIISGDRDLLQLASEHTQIRIPKTKKGGTEVEDYFAADVQEKYLVTPEEFIHVKALMGDASDNIPGIPGVGEKTAVKIISEFHSIENAYAHLDKVKPPRARNSLRDYWEDAQLSLWLATIDRNAPFELDLSAARIDQDHAALYTQKALELCKKLELRTMIKKFSAGMKGELSAIPGAAGTAGETETASESGAAGKAVESGAVGIAVESGAAGEPGAGGMAQVSGAAEATKAAGAPGAADGSGIVSAEGISIAEHISAEAGKQADSNEESNAAGKQDADLDVPVAIDASDRSAVSALMEEASAAGRAGIQIASYDGKALGFAVAFGNRTVYVQGSDTSAFRILMENADQICAIDLKEQLYYLDGAKDPTAAKNQEEAQNDIHGIDRQECVFFDCAIGAYLLNPLQGVYSYDLLSGAYAGRMVPSRDELFGKKKDKDLTPEDWMTITCISARAALEAEPGIRRALEQMEMDRLFDEIEMPLVFVLYRMQQEGVAVKAQELHEYGVKLQGRIHELEQRIYQEAGEEFNINSPKQLGSILFDRLHLPSGKKTKTGYSTAADVLEKLAEYYPIVSDILEYRQLTKLKSTYAEGLSAFISPDGRIHGKFNQTITATGRISSADPNLQNIPVRTELGRELRKVFVPKDGYTFVDADYSQIELRVLAHMSGDEALIQAYNSAEDIHAITASAVFHVPLEEVTPQLRRNAKAVNFGIVYGISSFGLSQGLSITKKEAADFIQQYFKTFPRIKTFLDDAVKNAKAQGFCKTLFGRRRPVPELKESNFMRRQFGERVAMNAPIQGTAADIIKIAMIGVDHRLRAEGLKSRLVLQIHDELLVETALDEVEAVERILREEMEGAASMRVKLEIDMHAGASWYEAH